MWFLFIVQCVFLLFCRFSKGTVQSATAHKFGFVKSEKSAGGVWGENNPTANAISRQQKPRLSHRQKKRGKASIKNGDNNRVFARIAFLFFEHRCDAAAPVPVSLAGSVTLPVATMKLSKLSNQTNSQDPQAVNSRIFVGNLNTFQCSKTDVERMFQIYGRLAGKSLSSSNQPHSL